MDMVSVDMGSVDMVSVDMVCVDMFWAGNSSENRFKNLPMRKPSFPASDQELRRAANARPRPLRRARGNAPIAPRPLHRAHRAAPAAWRPPRVA